MSNTKGYAAFSANEEIKPFNFDRREVGPTDVRIKIDYCGVCHSDIHTAHDDWGFTEYPIVPGHEIVGHVTEVGPEVKKYKVGDLVAVGCMVDSCGSCPSCEKDLEQFCHEGMIMTYGSPDPAMGGVTHGGYSTQIVVTEDFVLRVPESLDTRAVAPLLCAGITTYSPLRNWNAGPGQKVGVIGLGGLGHMGVKFASAMGAHVVMITTSPEKGEDAKRLGAKEVLVSKNEAHMENHAGSFDLLLNTVPVKHDLNPYIPLLKLDGTMVVLGATPVDLHTMGIIFGRKTIAGSLIGGIKETQEMLDFCGEHNIVSDIEMIKMEEINEAWERVVHGDVKYRFVIDVRAYS